MCHCHFSMLRCKENSPIVTNFGNNSEILYSSPILTNEIIVANHSVLQMRCQLGNLTVKVNPSVNEKSNGILFCENNNLMSLDHTYVFFEIKAFECTRFPEWRLRESTELSGVLTNMKVSIKTSVTQFFNVLNFEFDNHLRSLSRQTTVSTLVSTVSRPNPTQVAKNPLKFIAVSFYEDIDNHFSQVFSVDYQKRQYFFQKFRYKFEVFEKFVALHETIISLWPTNISLNLSWYQKTIYTIRWKRKPLLCMRT